jgi:hypothetical protein
MKTARREKENHEYFNKDELAGAKSLYQKYS